MWIKIVKIIQSVVASCCVHYVHFTGNVSGREASCMCQSLGLFYITQWKTPIYVLWKPSIIATFCRHFVATIDGWPLHSSIDHWNYFQHQRVTWPGLYRNKIAFLHIVVWHMSVNLHDRSHMIRVRWPLLRGFV